MLPSIYLPTLYGWGLFLSHILVFVTVMTITIRSLCYVSARYIFEDEKPVPFANIPWLQQMLSKSSYYGTTGQRKFDFSGFLLVLLLISLVGPFLAFAWPLFIVAGFIYLPLRIARAGVRFSKAYNEHTHGEDGRVKPKTDARKLY